MVRVPKELTFVTCISYQTDIDIEQLLTRRSNAIWQILLVHARTVMLTSTAHAAS